MNRVYNPKHHFANQTTGVSKGSSQKTIKGTTGSSSQNTTKGTSGGSSQKTIKEITGSSSQNTNLKKNLGTNHSINFLA